MRTAEDSVWTHENCFWPHEKLKEVEEQEKKARQSDYAICEREECIRVADSKYLDKQYCSPDFYIMYHNFFYSRYKCTRDGFIWRVPGYGVFCPKHLDAMCIKFIE